MCHVSSDINLPARFMFSWWRRSVRSSMMEILFVVRLAHVVAGVGWLGEVVTINFVLLPALFEAKSDDRLVLLNTVFPHVFRLATVLGGTAVASGAMLALWYTHLNLVVLVQSQWGWLILAGGT